MISTPSSVWNVEMIKDKHDIAALIQPVPRVDCVVVDWIAGSTLYDDIYGSLCYIVT